MDKLGNGPDSESISTRKHPEVNDFVDVLKAVIVERVEKFAEPVKIVGSGIGAPNGNFYKGTIEFAPNLSWKGVVPLVELFQKRFDLPVFLTNDANAPGAHVYDVNTGERFGSPPIQGENYLASLSPNGQHWLIQGAREPRATSVVRTNGETIETPAGYQLLTFMPDGRLLAKDGEWLRVLEVP